MPIVDGLTSAKMIRSYEKTHTNIYSPRAKLCGRVPIIAVSASLVERDRQKYIDGGFDGWILKPIPFDRLNKLLAGIVDKDMREEFLYQSGQWERGGWFHMGKKSSAEANTTPSNEPPVSNPSQEMQDAAHTDGPNAGQDESTDKRDVEQARLMQNQAEGKTEAPKDESGAPQPEESEDALPIEFEVAPKAEDNEAPQDAPEEQNPT
jgi:CheY-like chemotaxis protein